MIITYQGKSAIKIQQGDLVVALNPISKESDAKASSFGSDIVIISTDHPDCNGISNATRGDREPFVIKGPGEYEVKDVIVKGFLSETNYGGKKRINTIYRITIDEMTVLYLGALGTITLSSEVAEEVDNVDILIAPIGGEGALDANEAYKLVVSFEPKITIPILFDHDKKGVCLKEFTSEGGYDSLKPEDKLTIKKKDLADKDGDVVVLSPGV